MKMKALVKFISSVIILTISTSCGTTLSAPTVAPIPSKTAMPTLTLTPTLTSTPTMTPTETLTPIMEKDLQPAHIETVTQNYMDVQITIALITDKSMDSFNPPIHKIYINPHFNNYEGENANVALAHFIALALYKSWRSRQNPPQPTSDADFKSYLQLWSQAQKSNNPLDWAKVQIDGVWANDLNDDNGYMQEKHVIWPMYTGDLTQVPQEVRAITEIGMAIGRSSKLKNITIVSETNFGVGTNLDVNKLLIYATWGSNPNEPQHTAGWQFTTNLLYSMMWLNKNRGGSTLPAGGTDKELYRIVNHHNNPGDCCFRSALKIDPPTKYENAFNP